MDDVRLVDANSILKKLKSELDSIQRETNYPIGISDGLSFAMATIDTAPTIDAQPVKRGQWVTSQQTPDDGVVTCSYCHVEYYIDDLVQVGNEEGYCEFCPHCGADMRVDDADS